MAESKLIKDWKGSDVQRMRNIITKNYGDKTTTQVGYTKENVKHIEGDIWEENNKQWTIKNGIKQTITKLDIVRKQVSLPLVCPKCSNSMVNRLDKIMYPIHTMCFNCVIDYETELKRLGKFEEHQNNINKNGLKIHLQETENILLELMMDNDKGSFITENGDIEAWNSNNSFKEMLVKDMQEYIQKIKDTLNS